jgi:hypothetical protein
MASLPHSPQLLVVLPSLGRGAGARPPVSTVTTFHSLSEAAPFAQYRTPFTATPASSPSVWQKPTASS